MPGESIVCPKCEGSMEPGFILDVWDTSFAKVSEWVKCDPEYGFFGHVKQRSGKKHEVTAYRRADCGYIESYALPQQD
jgi:hypothetical protein